MRPFTTAQLCILAQAYSEATGVSLPSISGRVTGGKNHKLFARLIAGQTCTAANAEAASEWFVENWPEGIAWPKGVAAEVRLGDAAA